MKMDIYDFNIKSKHPKFYNRIFRTYNYRSAIIGVWNDEQFEIEILNKSPFKIQAKVSIDGVCTKTEKLASIKSLEGKWTINKGQKLIINKWDICKYPLIFRNINQNPGVRPFVSPNSRGLIALAVYKEEDPYLFNHRETVFQPIWSYMDKIHYEWWDELKFKLNQNNAGFPADDLGYQPPLERF